MATVTKSVTLVEFKQKQSLVPAKWLETVRPVGMSECKEAALSLAHAFAADHLHQYLVGSGDMASLSAEERWKLHVDLMTYIVATHCYDGIASTIGPDYEGVALWMPPGGKLDTWLTTFRSGMWRLYFQLSPEGRRRYYDELLPLLHDTKLEVLGDRDDDSYYLVYLGTKPSGRGRGYARKLLEDMIDRADAENRPMYLECSLLDNVALYRKFGFEVKKDIFLKRGEVPVQLSIMVREPRPPRAAAYNNSKSTGTGAGTGTGAVASATAAAAGSVRIQARSAATAKMA